MIHTKLLVNFTAQHCMHCTSHRGSNEYKALIAKGYQEVGTIREGVPNSLQVYWEGSFFNPVDKYIANPNPSANTDSTTT